MLQSDPNHRPDIRQLLSYLENPNNQVALTVSAPIPLAARGAPPEQLYECACCRQFYHSQDLTPMDGYYICRACNQVILAEAVSSSDQAAKRQDFGDSWRCAWCGIVCATQTLKQVGNYYQCDDCSTKKAHP